MSGNVGVIICAGGASSRFGGKRKKPFVDVGGRAVFLRSVELFSDRDDVKQILLGIPEEDAELVDVKWGTNLQFFGVKVFAGGDERVDTVRAGLELLRDDIELVAVHDAVRCGVRQEWVDECIKQARESGAAILAAPVVSTIKEVKDGEVARTLDRSGLWAVQTPQIFKRELITKAYKNLDEKNKRQISDDSQLVELLGEKVRIVETDSSNIKITQRSDIWITDSILRGREKEKKPKRPIGPYEEAQW